MLGIKETVFSFHSWTIRCWSGVRRVPDTRKPLHLVKVSDFVEVKSGNQSNKYNLKTARLPGEATVSLSLCPLWSGKCSSWGGVVAAGRAAAAGVASLCSASQALTLFPPEATVQCATPPKRLCPVQGSYRCLKVGKMLDFNHSVFKVWNVLEIWTLCWKMLDFLYIDQCCILTNRLHCIL